MGERKPALRCFIKVCLQWRESGAVVGDPRAPPSCGAAVGHRKQERVRARGRSVQEPPGGQGSQLLRSALSRERLLVFRGDTGLGGLLRLELLDAVECLGESESSPS